MGWSIDRIMGLVTTTSKLTVVRVAIPGIGTAIAYTAADAFGTKFAVEVPKEGTISTVVFHDYDDEGLPKEIVLFSSDFTGTADNGVFAPSDQDLLKCVGVISIGTFYNFSANQIGMATPALYYVAPESRLYGQVVTRGVDNIAVDNIPTFTMVIV